MLSERSDELVDANCLFDAQRGSTLATQASVATLSVSDAGKYLNAPRVQRDRLYRAGIIVPRIRGGDHGAADQFAPEDLDAFLTRLLEGAQPVRDAAEGQVTIPQAAHRAFCMSEDVVRLVLDGKIRRKWKLAGELGYMSLLLDLEEVRALVRGPDLGGLTGLQIKDKLSTTAKVAAALMKHGHLRTITRINPVNRCPTVVVPAQEVERFDREYVSLFAIAKQRGRHFLLVKKELQDAAVEAVFNPKKIGATFYRRTEAMAADDLT
jgi:hypothetical protein